MKKRFTILITAAFMLLTMMASTGTMWGQTPATLVSGSGTSGYAIPTGWTSSGTVEGGSYLKFDNGTITSPSFDPHTGLSFTYTVATFGSGTNHPLTIRILNASTNAIITELTTVTPTSSSYISPDSPLALGDVDVAFKIQMYAPSGKGIRLRNYSITGVPSGGGGGSDPEIHFNGQSANIGTNNPVGTEVSTSFTVYQSNLTEDITFEIAGNGSLDPESIEHGADPTEVTWSYTPAAAGSFNTTITATSGTASATYTIYGEAKAVYNVNIASMQHGTVTANPTSGIQGTNIDLTITPEEGYELGTLSVVDGDNNELTVTNDRFQMPNSDVTVSATFVEIAEEHWVETNLADLTDTDVFVIVGNNGSNYAMTNDNGTGSAPGVVAVTVVGNEITGGIEANIKWNISGNATDGYTFYPNGNSSKWLYCTNTNNGVRVGTNDNKLFVINSDYLYNTATSRHVGIYNSQDWRCYSPQSGGSVHNNIAGQTFAFYKKTTGSVVPPSISANNVDIAYNTEEGSIAYTINNPVEGGTLTASTESDWLTLGAVGETIPFTCSANEGTERAATVTLTYTYNDTETVTKDVTITQAAAPVIYTTIPEIFAAATSTETPVHVTFNNWVVSGVSTNGKNVYVTDGTNGLIIYYTTDMSTTFSAGNVLNGENVSCTLKLFNGAAELLNVDAADLTITTGGTVTPADIAMADLTGVNTGALLHYENLTCTLNNNKYFLTDGTTSIQLYNSLYAFTNPTVGKIYNITGVYAQYNTTKEIMPRSDDDIELAPAVATPTFDPAAGTYTSVQNVTITCATEGATIYYTTNGSTPTTTSTQYTSAIEVAETKTIKAIAVKAGMNNSEIATADYIINLPVPTITVAPAEVNAPIAGGDGTLTVTYNNITTVVAEVYFCTSTGEATTYDWIDAEINSSNNVDYSIDANSGAARTAYLKVYALDDDSNDVYSNLVTIHQAAPDYATLPFVWEGGSSANFAALNGVTLSGNGSDYGSTNAPYLIKLDSDGDYIMVKTDSQPGNVNIGVKMIGGGNTSTITIKASADGETFDDGETLTISGAQNDIVNLETTRSFGTEIRYVKMVFTKGSNVGVGPITIAQVSHTPSITLDSYAIDVDEGEHEGNNGITYQNLTITQPDDFGIQFYDSNNQELNDEPDWILTEIQYENDAYSVYYQIGSNNSDARTAYFKVWALDDNTEIVYSNLVTVTQAGPTPKYAVIFDLDGGTFVGNDDFPTDAEEKEAGSYTLPSATKENFNFVGWLLDGTENIYAAGESYEVTADVSFTAQWSNAITATITFGNATGSTNINGQNISGDDSAGNTWTITTAGTTSFTPNADYSQIGKAAEPATSITFTMTLPYDANITAFSAKFGGFNNTAGDITLKVGETTVGTGSLNATADVTVENTTTAYGKVLTITVTSISKGVKAYYISYSYTMSTDPIINAPASIDLASDATEGEFEYSISNPATGVNLNATSEDSWISNFVITDNAVSFTTTANTEMTERQGTITLSYTGAESKDVTVIQAAYIPPFASTIYTKATSITSGEHYIIVGFNGTDAYAMGLQNNNNRGAVIVNEDGTTATVTNEDVYDLVINYVETTDEKDYYSIYDARTPGYLYAAASGSNHLKTETTLSDNSKWVITFADGHANIVAEKSENRNVMQYNSISAIFSCYGSDSQTPVYLYAKSNVAPTTNNTTVTGTDFTATTPAGYRLIASPVTVNPVTTGMTTNEYDLYSFDESEETEWRNYKASHFNIIPGKGYLYANSSTTELTFTGSPYEGDGKIALDYTDGASFAGWNLIGNPFGTAASLDQPYYRLNSDGSALSVETESSDINVMEGVFVQATAADQIATFTAQTRNAKHRSIAQANIMISQNGSILDKAIVRFDNGSTLGKFQLNENSSKVFFTKNSQDYAIVCSDVQGEMPVNFKAAENGTYTIDFSMDNVEFSYLHLIDNKTGMDIDLLQTSSYTFEASKIDYASRFKLVFSTNNNSNSNDDNDFAFFDANGNLLILGNEGTATLQVIDITGRTVSNETFSGNYSKAINAKAGVYMLRLIQGNDVRTQKIVVR